MKTKLLLVTLLLPLFTIAQKNTTCQCPISMFNNKTNPDTVFYFSKNRSIALCGYREQDKKPVTFDEFVLAECGKDTIIHFWGALQSCTFNTKGDTLYVNEQKYLPIGKDFKFEPATWTIEKVYWKGAKILKTLDIDKNIPKYTPAQIQIVLKKYETSKPHWSDDVMKLANMLFIAAISGNETARNYFINFEKKFGESDGAYAEEYKGELLAMLRLWDSKK